MENDAFASDAGEAASPVADAYTDPEPDDIRILVVEEDPSYLATLTEMLLRRGYKVTAKASPEEGLRALRDNPEGFDLVMSIAHTQGAGIDGFDLLKQTMLRYPVVLFYDGAPAEMVMRAILGGAADFLDKPLEEKEIATICQHVYRRKLENEAYDAYAQSSNDVDVRGDDRRRKRGSEGLDDSDEGDSDEGDSAACQQQKLGRPTKKTNFNSSPQQHASTSFVKAAEQLGGTEDVETAEKKEGSGEHIPPYCQDKSADGRI